MSKPQRIQLKRVKGFRLQEVSKALNGLEAVKVARPSKWGNPYSVERFGREKALTLFRLLVYKRRKENSTFYKRTRGYWRIIIRELRGKNLACFCKLDETCHADILLELANK